MNLLGCRLTIDELELPLPVDPARVCPDYDQDCFSMSLGEARWCYAGLCNHPCGGTPEGIGKAAGYCPIIARSN